MLDFPSKFKGKKVKRSSQEIELQEVFLDTLSQGEDKDQLLSERKIEVPLSKRKLIFLFSLFFLTLFLLFLKTFQLQVIQNDVFLARAQENKFIIYQTKAERGVIYDKFGKQLVWNSPSFDLIFNKRNFSEKETDKLKALEEISIILEKDYEDIDEMIKKSNSFKVLISRNLDHQILILLEVKISQGELPGFQIEQNLVRDYKDGSTFVHLIGYTGKIKADELKKSPDDYSVYDFVGRDGLERSYEETLRKKPGKLQIEKDALGNQMSKEIISLPESGKSLVLWLDSELQKKIKEELEKSLERIGAKKGVAIALDPKTGGILSLVSLPSFDNNLFSKEDNFEDVNELFSDLSQPLFNRAISGRYPTGSTIKPLIATAALEEKIISPEKQIYAGGFIEIPHRYDPEIVYIYEDWKVHGWVDMRKAIAVSSNVYFYTIGGGYEDQEGLGPTRIKKYLELFGWGDKTGIDLPGEAKGFLPSPAWKKEVKEENWWDGDTYLFSIGQGDILITPLQVVNAFSTIANNGKLLKPQVVQKIIDTSTDSEQIIKEMKPEIIRENFVDLENLKVIKEGMREAVVSGSSVILNSLPVKSAAKTGTAQTSKQGFYHNWVSVFAPYDDPQIVLTILIEDVEETQIAALPVAKEVLEWYFSERQDLTKVFE